MSLSRSGYADQAGAVGQARVALEAELVHDQREHGEHGPHRIGDEQDQRCLA